MLAVFLRSLASFKLVTRLVAARARVNRQDETGTTALMYAAQRLALPTVKALVEAGADVNTRDKKGWTAFMHAVRQWFANGKGRAIVEVLLAAGSDVNCRGIDGFLVPHAVAGSPDAVTAWLWKAFVESGAHLAAANALKDSILHVYLTRKRRVHAETVAWLVHGGAPLESPDRHGRTPPQMCERANPYVASWMQTWVPQPRLVHPGAARPGGRGGVLGSERGGAVETCHRALLFAAGRRLPVMEDVREVLATLQHYGRHHLRRQLVRV